MTAITMSVLQEFATVDAVLATDADTRGVDAFALSLIKAERQLRKLFTHLVFQSPAFRDDDVPALRQALAVNTRVYYRSFIAGIDDLSAADVPSLVGPEHERLRARLSEAVGFRNKIFHGQLTDRGLTRDDLFALVGDIRDWSGKLASGSVRAFGYDGFGRNSFHKSSATGVADQLRRRLASVAEYRQFILTVLVPAGA